MEVSDFFFFRLFLGSISFDLSQNAAINDENVKFWRFFCVCLHTWCDHWNGWFCDQMNTSKVCAYKCDIHRVDLISDHIEYRYRLFFLSMHSYHLLVVVVQEFSINFVWKLISTMFANNFISPFSIHKKRIHTYQTFKIQFLSCVPKHTEIEDRDKITTTTTTTATKMRWIENSVVLVHAVNAIFRVLWMCIWNWN